MNYKQDILEIRKQRKVSVAKLAKITEIPVDRIYKWESGIGNPKSDDAKKLQEWLNEPEKLQEKVQDQIKIVPQKEQKDMVQVLADLAAANREIAESNKQLSKNQEVLLSKIKSPERADPKTTIDDLSRQADFLELLSEVLSGRKMSKKEALVRLSRYVLVPGEKDG